MGGIPQGSPEKGLSHAVFKPHLLLGLAALGLYSPAALAVPVNFGNAGVFSAPHGLFLFHPATSLDGKTLSGWSSLEVGVSDGLSVAVDTLYLHGPTLSSFGTTFAGFNLGAKPTPWLSTSLNPRFGHATGGFGRQQAALRAHADFRLGDAVTLYTMPAYYHSLDGGAPSAMRFNMALEVRPAPQVCAMVELLMGSPDWEFGPATSLGLAPGIAVPIGPIGCKASLRIPVLASAAGMPPEGPTLVLGAGSVW